MQSCGSRGIKSVCKITKQNKIQIINKKGGQKLKHKLLKLNIVLLLGLGLTPLQGQNTINVRTTRGSQVSVERSV
jgi:hypothetical protein